MEKFNQKKALNSLGQTVGVTAGMAVGGAITNVIPLADKRLSQGLMVVGGVVLSVMLGGKSKQDKILKSVAQGVAARGSFDLMSGVVKDSVEVSDSDSIVGKLTQGALGLACPCSSLSGLNANLALPPVTPVVSWEEDTPGIASPEEEEMPIA